MRLRRRDYVVEELSSLGVLGLWLAEETTRDVEWRDHFDELNQLAALQTNWDGEGAEGPSRVVMRSVENLLGRLYSLNEPPPSRIVATPDGTVVIEWQDNLVYRECEVVDPGRAEWLVQYPDGLSATWDEALFMPSETWVNDWQRNDVGEGRETSSLWQNYSVAA